jgi:hypothetical protein
VSERRCDAFFVLVSAETRRLLLPAGGNMRVLMCVRMSAENGTSHFPSAFDVCERTLDTHVDEKTTLDGQNNR